MVEPWSRKNPSLSKITPQDHGEPGRGYVNLLPFVRGEGGVYEGIPVATDMG